MGVEKGVFRGDGIDTKGSDTFSCTSPRHGRDPEGLQGHLRRIVYGVVRRILLLFCILRAKWPTSERLILGGLCIKRNSL